MNPIASALHDDAIIAATAIENNQILVSGNCKRYKPIKDLEFRRFTVRASIACKGAPLDGLFTPFSTKENMPAWNS
jgi:hypothetical protein